MVVRRGNPTCWNLEKVFLWLPCFLRWEAFVDHSKKCQSHFSSLSLSAFEAKREERTSLFSIGKSGTLRAAASVSVLALIQSVEEKGEKNLLLLSKSSWVKEGNKALKIR